MTAGSPGPATGAGGRDGRAVLPTAPWRAILARAAITVPLILMLGFASARSVPTGPRNAWYMALAKPPETPPDWVFPAAWTAIYALLGIVLAILVAARGSRWRGPAMLAFAAQMLANLAWSPLFFAAHRLGWALLDIAAMFAFALATAILVHRIRPGAGWLLAPYLAWLVYAGLLTYRIGQLNPGVATLVPWSSTPQIARH